jgi:hypothetical protein
MFLVREIEDPIQRRRSERRFIRAAAELNLPLLNKTKVPPRLLNLDEEKTLLQVALSVTR